VNDRDLLTSFTSNEEVVVADEERMAEEEHLQRRTHLLQLLKLLLFLGGVRLVQLKKCLTEWGIAVLWGTSVSSLGYDKQGGLRLPEVTPRI